MFPGAREKWTQEQHRNPTVEVSFNTYLFYFGLATDHFFECSRTQSDNHIPVNDDSAASSRCRPTVKLLKGKLLSITWSLLALKRWHTQKKAIFLWPLVHGGVGFSRPARNSSRSCCDGLTSDLFTETQLLVQADFVQLFPSVKCHLFYIHNTVLKLPSDAQFFFWPPMPGFIYCPRREIWKQKKQMKRPFLKFLCAFFFLSLFHHSLSF